MLKSLQLIIKIIFKPKIAFQEIKENSSVKHGIYAIILSFGFIEIIGLLTGSNNALGLIIFWFLGFAGVLIICLFGWGGLLGWIINKLLKGKEYDKTQNKAAIEITLFNIAIAVTLASLMLFPTQKSWWVLTGIVWLLLVFWFGYLEQLAVKILYSKEHAKTYLKSAGLFYLVFILFFFLTIPNFFFGNIFEKIIIRGLSVLIVIFGIFLTLKFLETSKLWKKIGSSFLTGIVLAIIFLSMFSANYFIVPGILFMNFCVSPKKVAIDKSGNIYIGDFAGVYKYNYDGKFTKKIKIKGYLRDDFIFLQNNNILITEVAKTKPVNIMLNEYTKDGKFIRTVLSLEKTGWIKKILEEKNGHLLLLKGRKDKDLVERYDENGKFLEQINLTILKEKCFQGIARDEKENIYLSVIKSIVKINKNGKLLKKIFLKQIDDSFRIFDIVIDKYENLYALTVLKKKKGDKKWTVSILKLNQDGKILQKIGLIPQGSPLSDIEIDKNRNIYFVDTMGHRVIIYDTNGNIIREVVPSKFVVEWLYKSFFGRIVGKRKK